MDITTVGVDLAKRVFAVHGVDRHGREVVRRMMRWEQMVPFFTRLRPCMVAMANSGVHVSSKACLLYWRPRRGK